MMNLKNFEKEIVSIAKANDMSWDIGLDMFIANIQNAGVEGAPYYAGANVDYAALKPEWMAMTNIDKADAKNEFNVWYRSHM